MCTDTSWGNVQVLVSFLGFLGKVGIEAIR